MFLLPVLTMFTSVNMVSQADEKTDAWKFYIQQYNSFIYKNVDSAYLYAKKMVEFAEKNNDKKKIAQSYIMMSFPEYANGFSDSARCHSEKAAKISEEIGDNLLWLKAKQHLIAIYQSDKHNRNAAEELLHVFETINLQPQDVRNLKECDNKLMYDSLKFFYIRYIGLTESFAKINLDQDDADEALEKYKLIMTIINRSGLEEQIERQYINIGHAYLKKSNTDSAFHYCNLALNKSILDNNVINISDSYELQGDLYLSISDYQKSITSYNKALYLSKDLNNTKTRNQQSLKAAKVMVMNEEVDEAKKIVTPLITQTDSLEFEELKMLYYIMTRYYAKHGITDSTERYFKLYCDASDKTSDMYYKIKVTDIETLFELKEEKVQNEILEQRNINSHRIITIWIMGALALFIIVLLVLRQTRMKTQLMKKLQLSHKKLQDFNETLAEKVKAKTIELHEANQELQRLEDAKSYFISLISHELNTPLSGIIGGISFLEASITDPDSKDICDMVKESANRLRKMADASRLITQIKIDDVQTKFETINVSMLLDEVKTYYHAQFANIKYEFETGIEDISLYINQYLIYKTLIVIIDNAIKFTYSTDPIIIRSKRIEDKFIIQVIDSGPGFSEHYLKNTYKLFISTDIYSHDEGLGLGLSTCKMIMDYHDGEIHIENGEDYGGIVSLKFKLNSESTK